MTVQTTSSKAGPFFGNGSTLIWNSGFRIDQPADLRVIYTDSEGVESQLDGTLYTVTGFGDDDGVSVTYPLSGTPISAAEKITLLREVSYDQQTSITNQGGFYPQVIERALDRIVYQTQQIAEKLGRAITLSASSTLSGLFLPDPESGKFLRGRADGAGYENADVTGGGSIGIPVAIADGGTGATTATAARGNLGATSVGDALFTTTSAAAARAGLGLPTTADVGAVAGAVMALDANGKVPAVDGSQLLNVAGLMIPVRQTVLQGSVDSNGLPTFLGAGSGLAPSIDGSSTPIILTAANGFRSSGRADRVGAINAATSFPAVIGAKAVSTITNVTVTATLTTTTPHNLATGATVTISGASAASGTNAAAYSGTFQVTVTSTTQFTYTMAANPGGNATTVGSYTVLNYLYGDIAGDGSVTLGSTILQPVYEAVGAFSTTSGQFTFNIGQMVGRAGNGVTADQVYRVFIGEVQAASNAISSVMPYALLGRYVSPVSASLPAAGTRTAYAANLGDANNVQVSSYVKCLTAGDGGWNVGTILTANINLAASAYQIASVAIEGRNALSVTAGANSSGWVSYNSGTGAAAGLTTANWGLFIVARRNWGGS